MRRANLAMSAVGWTVTVSLLVYVFGVVTHRWR